MKLSKRIIQMQESPIRKLVPLAEKAKNDGRKIYHLNIGQPDIETPFLFMEAVKNFNDKVLKYTFSQGIPELIEAIRDYFKDYNIFFERDEVLITNGGSEAILFSLISIADQDDEILIPEPFYTNYNGFAAAVGVNLVPITTKAEEGFHLPSKMRVEKLISPKTRAILLSNPGNPTGVIYTKREIKMLSELAQKHNLFIISDEVYREFIYDNAHYTSFGNMKDIEDRVIIIDSASKRFSACGARIGSICSKNKKLIKNILKLCQGRLCVPTLEQIGVTELYKVEKKYFESVNRKYMSRRDMVYDALIDIPGVICEKPQGAFYITAKLPIVSAEEFVKWLLKDFSLNNETVMLAPAEGFYKTKGMGKNEVRIAYVLKETDLGKAMDILKKAIEEYPYKLNRSKILQPFKV